MRLKKELGFLLLSAPPGGIGLASGAESAIFESYSSANQRRSYFIIIRIFLVVDQMKKNEKVGQEA